MKSVIFLLIIGLACMTLPVIGANNVLIILADDLGWQDVGFNGSVIRTPNLDQLAADGVRLQRYYAQPTCSPTRASLMTGQSALRNGVLLPLDKNNVRGLPLDRKILPQFFNEAGYQTALIGKWHLGHAYRDLLPMARGFDHVYGHLLGGIGHWNHIHGGGLDWQRNGIAIREEGYSTHLLTAETIKLLRERNTDRPFFYYLSLAAPHLPNEAPVDTVNRYQTIADTNRRAHAAMVDEIDRGVGDIVRVLKEEGVFDNTLIWFMSDNGGLIPGSGMDWLDGLVAKLVDWFGQPLPVEPVEFLRSNIQDGGADNGPYRKGKASVYEGGVLVPSFVHWPGRVAPGDLSSRISAQDVLPTLLQASDIPLPTAQPLDGISQWPLIAGTGNAEPSELVTTGVDGEAIYRGPWKLISRDNPELYNLDDDPFEANNLADAHPDMVRELQGAIADVARGESVHQTSWWKIVSDPDRFGGAEDRPPWIEQVRDRP